MNVVQKQPSTCSTCLEVSNLSIPAFVLRHQKIKKIFIVHLNDLFYCKYNNLKLRSISR